MMMDDGLKVPSPAQESTSRSHRKRCRGTGELKATPESFLRMASFPRTTARRY